jgi:hypothetical protein
MKLVIDTTSGEVIERELTESELEQQLIDNAMSAVAVLEETKKAQAVESGRAKLAALGLDEDEINAILGVEPETISEV